MTSHVPGKGAVLGSVEAPAEVPFRRLQPHISAEKVRWLLGLGTEPALQVGAEPEESMVWIHGGYWYRGEYTFQSAPGDRTTVTYRVRNISGHPDWLIRLWQRRHLSRLQHDVDQLAARLPGVVA